MVERMEEQSQDEDPLERVDELTDSDFSNLDTSEESGETSSSLRSRIKSAISPRRLVTSLAALGIPAAIGSQFIPLVGGPVGLLAGAFALGLLGTKRYTDAAGVGAALGIAGAAAGYVPLIFALDIAIIVVAVGALAGGALGALGMYFGRDFRDGLTRDI